MPDDFAGARSWHEAQCCRAELRGYEELLSSGEDLVYSSAVPQLACAPGRAAGLAGVTARGAQLPQAAKATALFAGVAGADDWLARRNNSGARMASDHTRLLEHIVYQQFGSAVGVRPRCSFLPTTLRALTQFLALLAGSRFPSPQPRFPPLHPPPPPLGPPPSPHPPVPPRPLPPLPPLAFRNRDGRETARAVRDERGEDRAAYARWQVH